MLRACLQAGPSKCIAAHAVQGLVGQLLLYLYISMLVQSMLLNLHQLAGYQARLGSAASLRYALALGPIRWGLHP